ncbi:hypothetical protein [Roseateles sp. LYH14W]|uniref:Outer membrane protein beta-barrel domain-containing protein n=1 Tax=Pelomonas parva TaxID=3299032 RepID=A0ABW7F391_9BURK
MGSVALRRHALATPLLVVAALGGPFAASADPAARSLWLRVEAFRADVSTNVRIDDPGANLVGTEFALERYGLTDGKTLPTVQLGYRFAERWRLELEYFRLSRTGRAELDRSITFNGTTFPVQATLDTHFRSDVGRASIGYSFLQSPDFELGATAGLHVTKFDISLQTAVSTSGSTPTVDRAVTNATVPLPTLGIYGNWGIASGWALDWRADLFALKHRGYDGKLINGQASLLYRLSPNAALGGGWRYVDYQVRSSRTDVNGKVDYKFKGPQLFAEVGF